MCGIVSCLPWRRGLACVVIDSYGIIEVSVRGPC